MASGSVTKAYLTLRQPSASGGGAEIGKVDFQFNPKEYTVQKSAKWKANTSRGARRTSMPEFEGAEPATVSLEIFLDATESASGNIQTDIDTLFKCVMPVGQSVNQNRPSPPMVEFGWGTNISFKALVKQVQAKYTMFKSDGTPLRAVCTVQLQEVPANADRQNPTSGGLTALRSHTVVSGDSLASIAYKEYGSPALWRAVAEANSIDDPMRIPVGTTLLLPPESEAAALS